MALVDRIKSDEGLRLQVYDDATGKPIIAGSSVRGNPTIGWGTLLSAPGGITQPEAAFLLQNRISIAAAGVAALVPGLAEQDSVRNDVLVEMAFQMGIDGLRKFSNTLQAVREKRWDDAANGMLDSRWAKQTPARAQALAAIMRSGHS